MTNKLEYGKFYFITNLQESKKEEVLYLGKKIKRRGNPEYVFVRRTDAHNCFLIAGKVVADEKEKTIKVYGAGFTYLSYEEEKYAKSLLEKKLNPTASQSS